MSLAIALPVGLAMGLIFGLALEKSRVFEPGMIVGQMQLRNFIMLRVFLAAAATGLVVLAALNGFGFAQLHPKETLYGANIIGGLIFGAGMVLAGACPGTVMAQIGAGYRDAWLVFIGGICGTIAYGYFEPSLKPMLLEGGPGKLTLNGLFGMPFWSIALLAAAVLIAVLVIIEKLRPWRDELGNDYDGLLIRKSAEPTGSATPGQHGH